MRDVWQAMVDTLMHLNKAASEFNNKLPGSTYEFTNKLFSQLLPFIPTMGHFPHM